MAEANKENISLFVDSNIIKEYLKNINKSLEQLSKSDVKKLLRLQEDVDEQRAEERKQFIDDLVGKVEDQTKSVADSVISQSFGSSKFIEWLKNSLFTSIGFLKDEFRNGFKKTREFLSHVHQSFLNGFRIVRKSLYDLGLIIVNGLSRFLRPINKLLTGVWGILGKVFKFLTGTIGRVLSMNFITNLISSIPNILKVLAGGALVGIGTAIVKKILPKRDKKDIYPLHGGGKSLKELETIKEVEKSTKQNPDKLFEVVDNVSNKPSNKVDSIKTNKPQIIKVKDSEPSTNVISNSSNQNTIMNVNGATTALRNTRGFNIGNPR